MWVNRKDLWKCQEAPVLFGGFSELWDFQFKGVTGGVLATERMLSGSSEDAASLTHSVPLSVMSLFKALLITSR